MTKDTFLNTIKGEARIPGQGMEIWDHAIKMDDNDPRWRHIYDESQSPNELLRQYCKHFGLEYRKPAKRKKVSQVERWAAEVEKVKARMIEYPDHMEAHKRRLAEMEANLAKAIKYNL